MFMRTRRPAPAAQRPVRMKDGWWEHKPVVEVGCVPTIRLSFERGYAALPDVGPDRFAIH